MRHLAPTRNVTTERRIRIKYGSWHIQELDEHTRQVFQCGLYGSQDYGVYIMDEILYDYGPYTGWRLQALYYLGKVNEEGAEEFVTRLLERKDSTTHIGA